MIPGGPASLHRDLGALGAHFAQIARPRAPLREIDALVLVQEGAGHREAAELAAVPVLRLYGRGPRAVLLHVRWRS